MAEYVKDMTSSKHGHSDTRESDELREMFCECCDKVKNNVVTAEGFCTECYEYMCATCIHYHNIYKVGHVIQAKATMPEDFCVDKCSVHPKDIVKFYCKACDTTACTKCKTYYHKNCTDISYIPELVRSGHFMEESTHLMEQMTLIEDELRITEGKIINNLKNVSIIRQDALNAIQKHKEEINQDLKHERQRILEELDKKREELLQTLELKKKETLEDFDRQKASIMTKINVSEVKLYNETEMYRKHDDTKLKTLLTKTDTMKTDLNTLKKNFSSSMCAEDKIRLFVAMKRASKKFTQLNREKEHVAQENNFYNFGFSVGKDVDIKSNTDQITIGYLTEKSKFRRNIKYLYDLETKTGTDFCVFRIRKLSNSIIMVVVYSDQYSLELRDLETRKIKTKKQFSRLFQFGDITKISDSQVAVAMSKDDTTEVTIFQISHDYQLTLQKEHVLQGKCSGMDSTDTNLILLFPETCEVKLVDTDGNILKTIKYTSTSKKSYGSDSIISNSKAMHICLRDRILNIDFNGNTLHKFDTEDLYFLAQDIADMTTDKTGTIFLAASKFLNEGDFVCYIYQISNDLDTISVLIDTGPRLHFPTSLCYCDRSDRLYVGYSHGEIEVYQISK